MTATPCTDNSPRRDVTAPPAVTFDPATGHFANLPAHWQERLFRNGLEQFADFQVNPGLLTRVFSLMDDELGRMREEARRASSAENAASGNAESNAQP